MTSLGTDLAAPTERSGRSLLLSLADRERLLDLAEICRSEERATPVFLNGPDVGTVMLQVREPIVGERFHLGEVVVSRAEVVFRGATGWAMRLGDDAAAAAAAAICDAECEAEGPNAEAVRELCRVTAADRDRRSAAEWNELAPTEVAFEELD
jgi:alpha-D-ribose 1-methylphosphonate 5-triphosphate synthase subunit PhnG